MPADKPSGSAAVPVAWVMVEAAPVVPEVTTNREEVASQVTAEEPVSARPVVSRVAALVKLVAVDRLTVA